MHAQDALDREWEAHLSPVPHTADRVFKAKVLSTFLRRKRADAVKLLEDRRKELQPDHNSIVPALGNRTASKKSRKSKRRERKKLR